MPRARKLLLVGEGVTLAHVARPAALMARLDPAQYDAVLACPAAWHRLLDLPKTALRPLHKVWPDRFAQRLRWGRPVLNRDELELQVQEDLALMTREQPDLVIGDFRLSLSVSARLLQVPYAAIGNAYWSPYAADRALPLPALAWTGLVPEGLGQWLFSAVSSQMLKSHCAALNQVRRHHGLTALPWDLRHIYCDADWMLYADSAQLFPLQSAPEGHLHIGPVLWEPRARMPDWWDELPPDRPTVYLTLGSSGQTSALHKALRALAGLPVSTVLATAGRGIPAELEKPMDQAGPAGQRIWMANFLPGAAAAERAKLVICNGGSPTSQQALAHGVPVLGLCGNLDQQLNMQGLARAGLGVGLRADRLSESAIRQAVDRLIGQAAERPLMSFPATSDFQGWLRQVLPPDPST